MSETQVPPNLHTECCYRCHDHLKCPDEISRLTAENEKLRAEAKHYEDVAQRTLNEAAALREVLRQKDEALMRCQSLYCNDAASKALLNREQHDADCFIRAALSLTPSEPDAKRVVEAK